jgi:peptide/nickel transport system permease protein
MSQWVAWRLVRMFLVWIGVTLVAFLLLRLTGDPARVVLGEFASPAAMAAYRAEQGLDRPWPAQYVSFVSKALRGDLGTSLRFREPNLKVIVERLPATLELALASLLISALVGVPLGVVTALRRDSAFDVVARGLVLLALGIPNFFLAILFVLLFGVELGWLPTGGRGGLGHLVMPAVVLSFLLLPLTVRITRSSVLDNLSMDYVRTARGKGVGSRAIVWRHVLRNASLPVVTVLGVQSALLLSGAVVTETIFSWPGIGRLLVTSITGRDFPLVQSAILVVSTGVVLIGFFVDLCYAALDPRLGRSRG